MLDEVYKFLKLNKIEIKLHMWMWVAFAVGIAFFAFSIIGLNNGSTAAHPLYILSLVASGLYASLLIAQFVVFIMMLINMPDVKSALNISYTMYCSWSIVACFLFLLPLPGVGMAVLTAMINKEIKNYLKELARTEMGGVNPPQPQSYPVNPNQPASYEFPMQQEYSPQPKTYPPQPTSYEQPSDITNDYEDPQPQSYQNEDNKLPQDFEFDNMDHDYRHQSRKYSDSQKSKPVDYEFYNKQDNDR